MAYYSLTSLLFSGMVSNCKRPASGSGERSEGHARDRRGVFVWLRSLQQRCPTSYDRGVSLPGLSEADELCVRAPYRRAEGEPAPRRAGLGLLRNCGGERAVG